VHKDAAAGKVACDSVAFHYAGDIVKQVKFESAEDAKTWDKALRKVLPSPDEHGEFQAWKPQRPGKKLAKGDHPSGQHHLTSTKASRAPLYREVQIAAMKDIFYAPVIPEDLKRLDAEARTLLKDVKSRKKVVATITSMRTRMRDAAWTAGGSDWAKLFRLEDKDHSGRLDWDEFRSMCRRLFKLSELHAPDAHLRAVFTSLDVDASGGLEFEELVAFVEDPVRRMRGRLNAALGDKADCKSFFESQDTDKSGDLDWEEFEAMCRKKLNIIDDTSQLAMVFEALDVDENCVISSSEFLSFVRATGERGGRGLTAAPGRAVPQRALSDHAIKPTWVGTR